MCRYGAWGSQALYYPARLLSQQLGLGGDYAHLRASVGVGDLFRALAGGTNHVQH
ncbi:hypothetical protein [Thiocystis violascens]|uniref:hypothetical protein n=1 Tax=Thiocystis violascens TaxID=73141 RepID=UPI00031BD397